MSQDLYDVGVLELLKEIHFSLRNYREIKYELVAELSIIGDRSITKRGVDRIGLRILSPRISEGGEQVIHYKFIACLPLHLEVASLIFYPIVFA